MKDSIRNIIIGNRLDEILAYVITNLYTKGPISITDLEILSYMTLYQPEKIEPHRDSILLYMGVFYKNVPRNTLMDAVFGQYRKFLADTFNKNYTPVQADIIRGIENSRCFSFSAPTSTGKSYVFIDKILQCKRDVVIVVPSRALINEYFLKLSNLIIDKSVNVLTFIDKINTRFAKKNVFIVTPERCRELFRQKDQFVVELFLFDEAQLSDEESKRGLYFDSIVRRCRKAYPEAKFVFAHPFVQNPESQIRKNEFDLQTSKAIQYTQKNVGQIFLCADQNWTFYHFGIDTKILGTRRPQCAFDPIEQVIKRGGSVLFYISKAKIYNRAFLNQFGRYIDLCPERLIPDIEEYIDKLTAFTGGDTIANKNHYSQMIALLRRGIVIHHGSLPLETRILIEQFTKKGLCRICFATSTLEQGINMPFDVVFLDRLERSKPLSVKNLIGRAGRSTIEPRFDFGYVILSSPGRISGFRKIMSQNEVLDEVSSLDKDDRGDDDFNDFKDAIVNDTFSDEYNLTQKALEKLGAIEIDTIVVRILDSMFDDVNLISLEKINSDQSNRLSLYRDFAELYSQYLGRSLSQGENNVLTTAIKIMLWRIYGRTFKNICWMRYAYATKSYERDRLEKLGRRTDELEAEFVTGFHDIPESTLRSFSLFDEGTKAKDVDYDLIMYDTYDYLDKLIGFKLNDIFFATFIRYFEKTKDERANRLGKYIRYGTDNDRHIWLLRYGLTFEDIEALDEHIENVSSVEIVFRDTIHNVSEQQRASVERFLH